MEEDVEIEELYKTHGQILREAATTAETDDSDEENQNSTDSSEVQSLENNKSADKKSKRKRKKRQSFGRRIKRLKSSKNSERKDGYSSDFEDLMSNELVSCLANKSESQMKNKDNEGEVQDNFIVKEILNDDPIVVERSTRVQKSHPEDTKNELLFNELTELLELLEKRNNLVAEMETDIVNKLIDNEYKQKEIHESLRSYSTNEGNGSKKPSANKTFYKKFGMCYFHDTNGFSAPQNVDAKARKQIGIPSRKTFKKIKQWANSDKDILQDAIHATLQKENRERLMKEILKLKGSLNRVVDELTEREIHNSIEKSQNQLQKLKCMSYVDLLAKENLDREFDWLKYSAQDFDGAHSADECRRFWHLYLKPTINKSKWTESEENRLVELVEENDHEDWDSIAQALGTNRSGYQTFIHYENRICDKKEFSTGKWTPKEDEKLLSIINSARVGNYIPWTKVASYMGDRTHTQIYNRYHNCLDPKLVKGKFSPEEDLLVVSGIEVFGASYQELSTLMSHRTANQIRERYERHLLPKNTKVGTFSLEEDELLLKLIEKHGAKKFSLIAKTMKTRSRTQVRQRYNAIMQIKKTNPDWTPASAKRRGLNKVPKHMLRTHKRVDKLRREMELIEENFRLDDLQNDIFKLEKLTELRDTLFLKKYDLKPSKKKLLSNHSEANTQLLEFFKNHNDDYLTTSLKMQSCDNAAYLNEMLLLAKYFGHDLELPKSPDEILDNKMLSLSLRSFLVQNLKFKTVDTDNDEKSAGNLSLPQVTVPSNIDYVEPEVDDTLIMEEKWHSTASNISNLNFSEFFKRTVFDYSNGMHRDIWESKMKRSKTPQFTDPIDLKSLNDQPFFIPPNSVTALGMKSVFLSRQRLRRDMKKKTEMAVTKAIPSTYNLQDKFMETLLSLFYCPKILSMIDISETLLISKKRNNIQSSRFIERTDDLVNISEEKNVDLVRKVNRPIKKVPLNAEKLKRQIMEQNRLRIKHLKDVKKGLTCDRKMRIEHLLKNIKRVPSKAKQTIKENKTQNDGQLNSSSSVSSEEPCKQMETIGVKSNVSRKSKKPGKSVVDISCDSLVVNICGSKTYKRTRSSSQNNPSHKKSLSPFKDVNARRSGIINNAIQPNPSYTTRSTTRNQSKVQSSYREIQM